MSTETDGSAPRSTSMVPAVRVALVLCFAACVVNQPTRDQPGPTGTWTCKQIVESCDSTCRTGRCLSDCSYQGSQQGGSLHATLIQCAAANRCHEENCTRAMCGPQVDACINDNSALPPIATRPTNVQPEQDRSAPPLVSVAPHEQADAAPPPQQDEPRVTPPKPDALTGNWSYGGKTGNRGTMKLDSDGRFERAITIATAGTCKTETTATAIGAWKLEGDQLTLSVKEARAVLHDACKKANDYDREEAATNEVHKIRMASPKELLITDAAGELQSYRLTK